jgi:cysteine desulfuration protein SufE
MTNNQQPMTNDHPPLPEKLDRIVQRFQRHSEPKKRYEQLLWYAKKLPPFPEADKVPENKVPGCVSQVYVTATLEEGKICFQGDSDAQITKGLLGLLIEGLSGMSPVEIVNLSPAFIQKTGLPVSLTPSRANGFYNIFKMLQQKASVYSTTRVIPGAID